MLRETLFKHNVGFNQEFRFRGVEPGRLENFSDAAFALAITLLLISTSPPNNFEQVKLFAWEIIPFVLCMALIVLIWHQHFVFFYRYGLRNPEVIVLNAMFLVLVLFYVYPLKYLTRAVLIPLSLLFDQETLYAKVKVNYSGSTMADLMIIYGLGATGVFLVLTLLYFYAVRKAGDLALNEIENFDTKASMQANMLMGAVPLLSVIVAFILRGTSTVGMWSGFTYFLYFPLMTTFWSLKTKRRNLLASATANSAQAQPQFHEAVATPDESQGRPSHLPTETAEP